MAEEYKKASELKVGDTIFTMSGQEVKIKRISKGFYINSLTFDWGDGDKWGCVDKETLIMVKK